MTEALFAVDTEARTIRGLLLPFNELSRPNLTGDEPIEFDAETEISTPADPAAAPLFDNDHDRHEGRGHATEFEPTEAGVVAAFAIAKTPEGDALLARAADKTKPALRLSAEVKDLVRNGKRAVSAVITGASIVTEGAFASAALFSVTGPITDKTPKEPTRMTVLDRLGDKPKTAAAPTNLNAMFSAIAGQDSAALAPFADAGSLFAIANVQHSGPAGATIGADTGSTGYLGELWKRQPYVRRFVPLIAHDDLLNYNIQGWRWVDGKEPDVDDYAGNAADIPSTPVDTEPVPTTANRLAGGNRLDRRFEDFNDQAVVASYLTHQAEAYARKSDARCLTGLINAATVVAPGTVPAGVAKGLAAIVDGALGVIGSENRPAWSLVSPELWRDIILTPHEDILGYLSASFGLEEGDMAGYKLMPANVGVGKVITGAKESATFYELPGSPVRVSGVNPGSGSSDIAAFGYWAQIINNAKAVASVTVAP